MLSVSGNMKKESANKGISNLLICPSMLWGFQRTPEAKEKAKGCQYEGKQHSLHGSALCRRLLLLDGEGAKKKTAGLSNLRDSRRIENEHQRKKKGQVVSCRRPTEKTLGASSNGSRIRAKFGEGGWGGVRLVEDEGGRESGLILPYRELIGYTGVGGTMGMIVRSDVENEKERNI